MAKNPMGGGFGDMGGLMRQAQQMQKDMERIKSELAERVVVGSAGGDVVKAHVNGAQELLGVKIDASVVDPDDLEMLEDLVTAAVNAGLKKAKEMSDAEMAKVTGGMKLPGMGM